jgi:hypothetical protein
MMNLSIGMPRFWVKIELLVFSFDPHVNDSLSINDVHLDGPQERGSKDDRCLLTRIHINN